MNIQTVHTKNLRWINILNPGASEVQWLRDNFRFHELHFQAVAERQQRPHIDQGPNYDFLVLLFPVYHKATQEIVPEEVDFFTGEKLLITVHYGQINTLKMLFDSVKDGAATREFFMQKGSGYLLYKILESLFRRSYPILDHMNEDINMLETKIFHRMDLTMLSKISLMKKNIIEFRKMMKTHRYVLEKLPKRKVSYLSFPQSKLYYRDLLEYSANIWDILEALKETAETLADTNQALATHRLNEITKMISILSAILLPATLVAFVFGVNNNFVPFQDHPLGFLIIIGLMIFSSLVMLFFFKTKKWF